MKAGRVAKVKMVEWGTSERGEERSEGEGTHVLPAPRPSDYKPTSVSLRPLVTTVMMTLV